MTIEEKAKAYDEALERAKAYHRNELAGSRREMTEYIFPELRESEDERIIEEIKFAVMQMPSERQDTKDRCLAWLEKQKEQKPVVTHDENGDAILSDFEAALFSAFSDAWQTYLNGENVNVVEWAKEQSASCDGAVAMKRAYDKLIDKLNSL